MADDDTKDFGYGQQDPTDSANEQNVLIFTIKQVLNRVSTAKPVKVTGVSSDGKTVDVQPMVNQVDGAGNATPHGTVYGVPVVSLQGGKNSIIMKPKAGDMGLMICSDRDISSVKANKDVANPGSFRKYDAADGIYIGGILATEDPEQSIEFTDTGLKIADKNGNKLESSPTGWLFTGNVSIGNLTITGAVSGPSGGAIPGNMHVTGTMTGDAGVIGAGKNLATHVHSGVQPGGGNSGPPV